jgi:hypothetical protein
MPQNETDKPTIGKQANTQSALRLFWRGLADVVTERLPNMSWSAALMLALGAAVIVVLRYSYGQPDPIEVGGFLLLIAGAGVAIGEFTGFLFGIPRTIQSANADAAGARADQSMGVNTNLEQISDWLTKIIVGVGLVELTKIPPLLQRLAKYLSDASPRRAVPDAVILAVLGSFVVLGFFSGYLWTRLYLTEEFSRAERQARERPEYYEGIIHALLYQPKPKGFLEAIKKANDYLTKGGAETDRLWVYLACAYGQQYDFESRAAHPSSDVLSQARAKALDAASRALQVNPEAKTSLLAVWDPERATPSENDLVVFFRDVAFRELFGYLADEIELITDKGRKVKAKTGPATSLESDQGAAARYTKAKQKVEGVGGKALEGPRSGSNCHGFTFDKGGSEIAEDDVRTILDDNYAKVTRTEAHICDVVVYHVDTVPDHSGLVVEIGADGKPSKIISKWGPTGGVFLHPPEDYGTGTDKINDWDVYRRTKDPDGLKDLTDAYNKAVQDHGASSDEAHDKARALCQAKNALSRPV